MSNEPCGEASLIILNALLRALAEKGVLKRSEFEPILREIYPNLGPPMDEMIETAIRNVNRD